MKTLEEITADIRRQRERIDEHIRELTSTAGAEEILTKLKELRRRSESTNGSQEPAPEA